VASGLHPKTRFAAKCGAGTRLWLNGGVDVLYQELWLKLTVLKWLVAFDIAQIRFASDPSRNQI
jgi:hypothetical protein